MRGIWVALMGCGVLLSGCGDDDKDRQEACDNERKLTAEIVDHAANVDQIDSRGLCTETEGQIAIRLRGSSVWMNRSDADVAARAHEYFVNCQKVSKAKAECGD